MYASDQIPEDWENEVLRREKSSFEEGKKKSSSKEGKFSSKEGKSSSERGTSSSEEKKIIMKF